MYEIIEYLQTKSGGDNRGTKETQTWQQLRRNRKIR